MRTGERELGSVEELRAALPDLRGRVVQGVDLRGAALSFARATVTGAIFLGCTFDSLRTESLLRRRGAVLFPRVEGLPYDPYRSKLYTWQELDAPAAPGDQRTLDEAIYEHMVVRGRNRPPILEALTQRIHDHALDDAREELLDGPPVRRPVGIMGGHGILRTDPAFAAAAEVAWRLGRAGYFVMTGGGPGIMEAGNLGAWMAPSELADLRDALAIVREAPGHQDRGWESTARAVLGRWPRGAESLAAPTWFYGHERSNLFATHIAKYFANSVREDGMLAVATYGIVFAPGSAGTVQEVFQDAAQNHYGTFDDVSPMVFLGARRWRDETGVYPLVQRLAAGRTYAGMLACVDDPAEAVRFIEEHPPVRGT